MRTVGKILQAVMLARAVLIAYVRVRLEPLRGRSERGASAVEWAIITGITVSAAVAIGVLVWDKINTAGHQIDIEVPTGGHAGGGGP